MEKIIFDTDPGIDDAMALLLIHSLNALDVVGITTCLLYTSDAADE